MLSNYEIVKVADPPRTLQFSPPRSAQLRSLKKYVP